MILIPPIAGFQHTAFTLSHEGLVHKGNIKGSDVPPGALVTLLQKALLYVGVEWHVRDVRLPLISLLICR